MRIEDQVPTLEQCKNLKELGVNIKTYFYWILDDNEFILDDDQVLGFYKIGEDNLIYYPAPTVAEFGVLLPSEVLIEDHLCGLEVLKYDENCWMTGYKRILHGLEEYHLQDDINEYETEAQAKAEALIWLITEGYVKAEELKL